MSTTKQVTVWCDACSNWQMYSDTAAGARRYLKKHFQWEVNVPSNYNKRKDYCPTCWNKGKR